VDVPRTPSGRVTRLDGVTTLAADDQRSHPTTVATRGKSRRIVGRFTTARLARERRSTIERVTTYPTDDADIASTGDKDRTEQRQASCSDSGECPRRVAACPGLSPALSGREMVREKHGAWSLEVHGNLAVGEHAEHESRHGGDPERQSRGDQRRASHYPSPTLHSDSVSAKGGTASRCP
jgi:hypothetical protein